MFLTEFGVCIVGHDALILLSKVPVGNPTKTGLSYKKTQHIRDNMEEYWGNQISKSTSQ